MERKVIVETFSDDLTPFSLNGDYAEFHSTVGTVLGNIAGKMAVWKGLTLPSMMELILIRSERNWLLLLSGLRLKIAPETIIWIW